MNNFNGPLNLYPEICIDNFDSNCIFNTNIRCYILTHFHDDHMKNLEDMNFYKLLKDGASCGIQFLCSAITKRFIASFSKYKHLEEFCRVVSCESPLIVKISTKESVNLTFFGSGHCPGSVMVFIEGSRGNVLFTGDFRLPLKCASRLPFLKDKTKKVNDLYVDMTFFKPEIPKIPTREESVKALLKFIDSFLDSADQGWIAKGLDYSKLVYLKTSARIGYEYVFQEINRSTDFKIHVNDLIFQVYDQLPEVQSLLTTNARSTPIHMCIYENRRKTLKADTTYLETPKHGPILPCELFATDSSLEFTNKSVNSVKIMLSAMWFTDTAGLDNIFVEYKPPIADRKLVSYKYYQNIYRLCFSFHSSMEEIIDFVDTIRPKRLYSIALPESTSEKAINEYFYAPNGNFIGFHMSNHKGKVLEKSTDKDFQIIADRPLMTRKRSLLGFDQDSGDSSNIETSYENSLSDLDFGSADEDKPIKKLKT